MKVVVGLGSNLGDRLGALRAASRAIGGVSTILAASRVYATAPIGPAQPEYLNAALLCDYDGSPEALLDALLSIEAGLGRVRGELWGPRTIDLDVLWIEGLTWRSERLVVPHPRLRERAFALVPLLEVAPGAIDPETGTALVAPEGDVRPTEEAL